MRWGFITPIYIRGNESSERFRNQGHSANQWLGLDINPSLSLSKVTAFPPFDHLLRRFHHPSSLDHSFPATPASVMFLKHAILSSIPRPLHLLSPLLETLFNQIFVKLDSYQLCLSSRCHLPSTAFPLHLIQISSEVTFSHYSSPPNNILFICLLSPSFHLEYTFTRPGTLSASSIIDPQSIFVEWLDEWERCPEEGRSFLPREIREGGADICVLPWGYVDITLPEK